MVPHFVEFINELNLILIINTLGPGRKGQDRLNLAPIYLLWLDPKWRFCVCQNGRVLRNQFAKNKNIEPLYIKWDIGVLVELLTEIIFLHALNVNLIK